MKISNKALGYEVRRILEILEAYENVTRRSQASVVSEARGRLATLGALIESSEGEQNEL